ncbi:MAG: hypothetical protein WAV93_01680 [Bacteroidales bacterium]
MLRYYVDDCEFGGSFNPIVLNGGIIIRSDQEIEMIRTIEDYKEAQFGHRFFPAKFNLKHLKPFYTKHLKVDLYERLMGDYDNFRNGLIETISKFDYKVLISCIQSFRDERTFVIASKDKLRRFAFSMCLMRFALEAKVSNQEAELIFDFPTGSNPILTSEEYAFAYRRGSSSDNVTYSSGNLRCLNFLDSVKYSCTDYSSLLQITDIYVGAAKHFIEHIQEKGGREFGYNLLSSNFSKFRGYPNRVPEYGFVFDHGKGTLALRELVEAHIRTITAG